MDPTSESRSGSSAASPETRLGQAISHRGAGTRRSAAALILVILTLFVARGLADVIVTPWGPPEVSEFPPDDPPDSLGEGEGDTQPEVEWSGGIPVGRWRGSDSTYTLDSLTDVTLTGHSHIRVPANADSFLRGHESGHDGLNKYEYDKHARDKILAALRGLLGKVFKGEGVDDTTRYKNARAKAKAARDSALAAADSSIFRQMNLLGAAFDTLTKNGRSETWTTPAALCTVKARHDAASAASQGPVQQKPSGPRSSSGPTNKYEYDGVKPHLYFTGPGTIVAATDPADAILGRGQVMIMPFIVVGPREDGTTLLSDSRLRIMDSVSGDTLLDGYTMGVAYMPSNVAGYAGMVQSYLWILPPSAHGIHNSIGSSFLDGMQAASDASELTMVWMYATAPLFDTTGACLIPAAGVPGSFTIGVGSPSCTAVPEAAVRAPDVLGVFPQPGTGLVRFAWKAVPGLVRLEVFDATGARRWAASVDGGRGVWVWDGRDSHGARLTAGVYFASLRGPGRDLRSRVVLVR